MNREGYIPDIYTFKKNNIAGFKDAFLSNSKAKFNLIEGFDLFIQRGMLYKPIIYNLLYKKYIKKYDIVINSNNSLHFLPQRPSYIHYIHFPIEASIKYINRLNSSIFGRLYKIPLKILLKLSTIKINGQIIANSYYTKNKIIEAYKTDSCQVNVVPPPSIKYNQAEFSGNKLDFLSLGAFEKSKKQLLQIRAAEKFPNINFHIVGSIRSKKYYYKCAKFIKKNTMKNVHLYPNLEKSKLSSLFKKCAFFIHTRVNEPFGMSTIEAISNGCIPLVHNSGGQKEIVPIPNLRFDDSIQLYNCIKKILLMKDSDLSNVFNILQKNVKKYTCNNFQKSFIKVLNNYI